MYTSTITQKIVRAIGVTLAVLAGIGLVISSFPMALFTPRTTPLQTPSDDGARADGKAVLAPQENSRADFPANFQFEIASTTESRTQGLSGRTDVPKNYGMLFVFAESALQEFWMKDMFVSIDIIWIDTEGTILGIEESVSPDSYPQIFRSPEPVQYVLETKAGEMRRLNLFAGDTIPLP